MPFATDKSNSKISTLFTKKSFIQTINRYLPFPAPVIFSVKPRSKIFPSKVEAGLSVIPKTAMTSLRPNTVSLPKALWSYIMIKTTKAPF